MDERADIGKGLRATYTNREMFSKILNFSSLMTRSRTRVEFTSILKSPRSRSIADRELRR